MQCIVYDYIMVSSTRNSYTYEPLHTKTGLYICHQPSKAFLWYDNDLVREVRSHLLTHNFWSGTLNSSTHDLSTTKYGLLWIYLSYFLSYTDKGKYFKACFRTTQLIWYVAPLFTGVFWLMRKRSFLLQCFRDYNMDHLECMKMYRVRYFSLFIESKIVSSWS